MSRSVEEAWWRAAGPAAGDGLTEVRVIKRKKRSPKESWALIVASMHKWPQLPMRGISVLCGSSKLVAA